MIVVKCLEQDLEHSKGIVDVNGGGGGDTVHITLCALFIGTYRNCFTCTTCRAVRIDNSPLGGGMGLLAGILSEDIVIFRLSVSP